MEARAVAARLVEDADEINHGICRFEVFAENFGLVDIRLFKACTGDQVYLAMAGFAPCQNCAVVTGVSEQG